MMIFCLMFMTTIFKKMDIGFQGSVFVDFLQEFEEEKFEKNQHAHFADNVFGFLFVKSTHVFVKAFVVCFIIFIFSIFCKKCVNLSFLFKVPFLLIFNTDWKTMQHFKNICSLNNIFSNNIIYFYCFQKVTIFCASRNRVAIHVRVYIPPL